MSIEPGIAQALAYFITACGTTLLLWAQWHWGPTQREERRQREEDEADEG